MFYRNALDRDVAAGNRRQTDEGTSLDVVGADTEVGPVEFVHPLDRELMGADPRDVRAHSVEEVAEVLDVRFGRCISNRADSFGAYCSHDGIFRTGNRGLIEEEVRADQTIGPDLEAVIQNELTAERLERQEVRIHPATPDDVSTWRREMHVAESRQKRTGQKLSLIHI